MLDLERLEELREAALKGQWAGNESTADRKYIAELKQAAPQLLEVARLARELGTEFYRVRDECPDSEDTLMRLVEKLAALVGKEKTDRTGR